MLDSTTKRRIDACRDILVGKVPDPRSQIDQITVALIYKFMHDMDHEAVQLGGKPTFFARHTVKVNGKEEVKDYAQYAWPQLMATSLGGEERVKLYAEALERMPENPGLPALFRDIFKNTFLPYRDPATLRDFLKHINEFTYDHSEKLGDAFEYLLSIMGSQGDAGQFRTPRHLIDFMAAVIDPQKHETILDPACGTAGFLISAYKHILRHNSSNHSPDDPLAFQLHGVKQEDLAVSAKKYTGDLLTPDDRKRLVRNITGYDIDPGMVKLSLVNLYLHGFPEPHIHEYDTLTSTDRWEERFDVVLANPPFMSPKGGIRPHGKFGIPSTRSEVLFVDYIAEHLYPNGRALVVVPEGIIFQSGKAYKALRKKLVDEHYLVGVVSLPGGVFNPYSGVKTSLLWFDRALARKTDQLLFVKVESDGFDLGAQRRPIAQNDLPEAYALMMDYKRALAEGTKWEAPKGWEGKAIAVERERIRKSADYSIRADGYLNSGLTTVGTYPKAFLKDICKVDWGNTELTKSAYIEEGKYLGVSAAGIDGRMSQFEHEPGVTVISAIGAQCGRVFLPEAKFTAIKNTMTLTPDRSQISPRFLHVILSTNPFKRRGAAQPFLSKGDTEVLQIPLPPLAEQEALVAEVEGYQQVIDGARQVLAHYKPRITIDPQWKMVELGELLELASGEFLPAKSMKEGPHPVYGGNGVNGTHSEYLFEEPTIVIGRVGAYCGAVHMTEPKSWITDNGLYVKKIKRQIELTYLKQILSDLNLNQYAKVGGQPSISQGTVLHLSIPLPPLPEQERIVAALEEERRMVEAARALAERMEARVRERVARVWGLDPSVASRPAVHSFGVARPDTPAQGGSVHEGRSENGVSGKADVARYALPNREVALAAEPLHTARVPFAERRRPGRPPKGEATPGQAQEAIATWLRAHPGWHGKGAVLAATGVEAGAWNAAIKALLEAGQVQRQGEKKGARYGAV